MEGPYLSHEKKGAQLEEALRTPDFEEFLSFYNKCRGAIRLVDVSPECENAGEFIARTSELCTVSIAHSNADYDMAMEAFRLGCTHVAHLFNAMTGLHHREPGIVGAVFDSSGVSAELICDGIHIHPAVLRAAFFLLGEKRSIIVSDSMRAAGLQDGESELGGQKVFNRNGMAMLEDGTLAGSTTNMLNEVRNLVRFGIPLKQVVRSATINPASAIGMDGEIGSIREGKRADLVILDEKLELKMVVARGMTGGAYVNRG
jgi:N-acetylglucosamine-6-phosphate deacetylase